ncbi:ubiquinol-cytochrome c reductase iron-sulfur subunit [bacterium]|nr:ubiquinol-cytochrome c reductase iron-sulfur subunit [bacterium]MBU1993235.1 ubiquinol-cytochrome c reductase iron-sulfur subunit [bacterium]
MGKAFGAVAAVGAVGSLVAMKKTWDPLPSVMAAGFTTVDLSKLSDNKLEIAKWQGKPIFILRFGADMPEVEKRSVKVGNHYYSVMIGLCTHLGCIPAYAQEEHKFKCACHGGEFDSAGVHTFGPPPRPLDIPPFSIKDENTIVLGEAGPEYKALIARLSTNSNIA